MRQRPAPPRPGDICRQRAGPLPLVEREPARCCAHANGRPNLAHTVGSAVSLKKDLGQAGDLQPYFDFAINEQCWQYRERNFPALGLQAWPLRRSARHDLVVRSVPRFQLPRCARRSTSDALAAGWCRGDHVARFPGSAGVAGRSRSLGWPVTRRRGAAVPAGAWPDGAHGRCQMSTYVLDQGRHDPGGAGRVMRICPSGSAGTAVTGNVTSCELDAVACLALIPA